ncbi:MAG: oligosaccharide flippase family protein [Planctomycetota bacterium]
MRSVAIRGVGWTLLSRGLTVVAQFGALLVLARLLDEHQFGLAWMVAVVVGVAGVAADLGMDVLVVQRKQIDDRHAAKLSICAGFATMLVVGALAPWISVLFGEPAGLEDLMAVGSTVLLLSGFGIPARARLRREFRFGRLAATDATRALTAGGAGIAFALHLPPEHRAWSLVLGDICAVGVASALAWLLAPEMRRGADRDLFSDGVRIVGTRLADTCFSQADRFFVGSRLGAGALGLYGFAWRHALGLLQNVMSIAEQVALPLFSRLQDDREGLSRAYLALTRLLALCLVPSAALLWGLAPWLIDLLYPDHWGAAVPGLRALCLAAAAAGLNSDPGLVWLALGRMRLRLLWSLANLVVIIPVVVVGTHYGIVGVAQALAARSLVATVVAQIITGRVAGVPHLGYLRALLPGMALGGAFVGAFLLR